MEKFNVVLTSNGFNNLSNRSEEIDNLFKEVACDKKVLIICNAAREESVNRVDIKKNFEYIGAAIVDTIDLDKNNAGKILEYDVVYSLGGQIQKLLECIHETSYKEYLIKFLEKGIFIGESSGAIVLSNDVKYYYDIKKGTKPKYDVVLNSYKGMGITNKNIYPHYNKESEEMRRKIKEYEEANNIVITPLNDGEFILENI